MLNFTFHNPVKIVFGKGMISELSNLVPKNQKVMMIYGGGSIKKNGVYDEVKKALNETILIEFGGIEPNPEYETCLKALAIAKKEDVSFILAVGGGSVIDAAKFIAAANYYEGEAWDILSKGISIKKALPIGTVLTIPATGSEMNRNAVISRRKTCQKLAFYSEAVYPRFSILDPEKTYSLPARQTVNGIVDAFVHVVEQYMTYDVNSPLQDRQAEAVFKTLIEEAPKVIENPNDYEARANIMWCATVALNHSLSCGVVGDWATHRIGHELTAKFGLDHAQALAIILPSLFRHQKNNKEKKLAQYGRRVFGITATEDYKAAGEAIEKTVEFFEYICMPTKLSAYNITLDECKDIPSIFTKRGEKLGEHQNIGEKEIDEILKGCQ